MGDREVILGVLRRIERRLWARRALQEVAFAVCVALFALVALKLAYPGPGVASVDTGAIVMLVALACYMVWRALRPVSSAQAAGEADLRAGLRDELKSALWFIHAPNPSDFMQMQVSRAAVTAAGLDPRTIVAWRLPRSLFAAAGLGATLVLVIWLSPQLTRSWDIADAAPVVPSTQEESLLGLLENAPADQEIEKLDEALGVLQDSSATRVDKVEAVRKAREAIAQANVDATAAREGLAKLAEAMKDNPGFGKVAQALQVGDTRKASELLKQMRDETVRRIPVGGDGRSQQVGDQEGGKEGEMNLAEALREATRDVSAIPAQMNQESIENVLRAIDAAGEQLEVQNRVNKVKRRMEDFLAVTAQRSALSASQFDHRIDAVNPSLIPDPTSQDSRGGTMYRQGAVARGDDKDSRDGSVTGSPSGDSPAEQPLEGAATMRLDAQLKRETFRRSEEAGNEDGDGQDWIYSASREEKSGVDFEEVRQAVHGDRENAVGGESIPVRQRQIVKNYFLNLHESEKK